VAVSERGRDGRGRERGDEPAGGERSDESEGPPDLDDALDELEELEELVDSPAEREQVRETMRTLRRAQPRPFGRLRDTFDLRDAGEALVGSFVFGIPMVVEGGTLEIGVFIATRPVYALATAALGLVLVLGILRAVEFEKVEADLLLGLVPLRLVGILAIACAMALVLMTAWGRVDWSTPAVAASQTLVTAVVMAVGASLGDILPGS
jgi:uncharacterized membrane protein